MHRAQLHTLVLPSPGLGIQAVMYVNGAHSHRSRTLRRHLAGIGSRRVAHGAHASIAQFDGRQQQRRGIDATGKCDAELDPRPVGNVSLQEFRERSAGKAHASV
jgi:hypothetical protein